MKAPAFKGLSILAACAALVGGTVAANASSYLVTIQQVGSAVVASGSGSINLTGLNQPPALTGFFSAGISASAGAIGLSAGFGDLFTGTISGPTNFGAGGFIGTGIFSGPIVGFSATDAAPFNRDLRVPLGYVSDSALGTSTDTFAAATLASLGLIPGTYVWTWGLAPGAPTLDGPAVLNTFTVQIGPPVPLPATLPLFATGLAGLGLLGWRRKKKAAHLNA
jgi:hypothetical protein